jgi:hypothetical protein
MKNLPNHVIFLGAGASYTSGYPIGQELRLRIASKNHFTDELKKFVNPESSTPPFRDLFKQCVNKYDSFAESIELFRHGGFGTVDEFSKLASSSYPQHVQNIKTLIRRRTTTWTRLK